MVEDVSRTLKATLEDRLGQQIPCASPSMAWLSAMPGSKYNICTSHVTGNTRSHRKTIRVYKMTQFGEQVRWYAPKKRRLKTDPTLRARAFLGSSKSTNTNYIGVPNGSATTARALFRVPESGRWDAPEPLAIAGTQMALKTINFDKVEESSDPHRGQAGRRHNGPDDDAHVQQATDHDARPYCPWISRVKNLQPMQTPCQRRT